MNVLFAYKYLGLGGVETVLRSRLVGLGPLGVQAHAWFLRDGIGSQLFEGLEGQIHVGGVHDLQRFLEEWRPEVFVTIDTEEVFPILRRTAWPMSVLVECHTPYPENRVYLRMLREIRPNRILVPSDHQKAVVEADLGREIPVSVVPNPVSREFADEVRQVGHASAPPLLCWVGRLDHLKNWTDYLRLCARVAKVREDARFWLIGDGDGRDTPRIVLRRVAAEKIAHKVRWFRGVPHERLPSFFDAVRSSGGVVVSTSRQESFGMAIAEAMARQCACVVPDSAPFDEFVEDGISGLRIRQGSVGLAATAVLDLLDNEERRTAIGVRAREEILRRHSPDVAISALAQVFKSLEPQLATSLP